MLRKTLISALLMSTLIACGGTSVPTEMAMTPPAVQTPVDETPNDPADTPVDDPAPMVDPRVAAVNAVQTELASLRNDRASLLNLGQMQAIGSATYSGPFVAASGIDTNSEGFFGDGTLNINFTGDGAVSGGVTNITHSNLGLASAAAADIPADAVLTPLAGTLEFDRVALNEGDNIGLAAIRVGGTLTVPGSLNDTGPDAFDIGMGGSIIGLFTDDQVFGGTGLIARRFDDNRINTFEALFLGDRQ